MFAQLERYLIRYKWFRSLPIKVNIKLRCIVYRDEAEGEWIARCLDLNLIATSIRKSDVVKELLNLIVTQIQFVADNNNWEYLFHPASKKEWDRFEQMKRQCQHERTKLSTSHIQSTVDMCFA